jgi:hypothetical protein
MIFFPASKLAGSCQVSLRDTVEYEYEHEQEQEQEYLQV